MRTIVIGVVTGLLVVCGLTCLLLWPLRPNSHSAGGANAPAVPSTSELRPWRVEVRGAGGPIFSLSVIVVTKDGRYLLAAKTGEALFAPPVAREGVDRVFAVSRSHRSPVVTLTQGAAGNEVLTLEESASLTVSVVDTAGNPLAGAGIAVGLGDPAESADWVQAVELGLGESIARTLITSTRGTVFLPALPAGRRVAITAQGPSGAVRGEVAKVKPQDSLRLVLTDGGAVVAVQCNDRTGAAIPDVAITYEMFGGSPGSPLSLGSGAVVSNSQGTAGIHLGESSAVIVTGVEKGWLFASLPEPLSASRPRVEIVLLRVGLLGLKLTYEDGLPFVGGVSVYGPRYAWEIEPARHPAGGMGGRPSLRMGDDGSVTIPGMVEGDTIAVHALSGRDGFVGLSERFEVLASDLDAVRTLVLNRMAATRVPGRIRVTGIDDETAWVEITDQPWANPADAFAIAERSESGKLRAGTYCVRVSGNTVGWLSQPIELAPGETRELVVPKSSPGLVRAQVVDKDGSPVPGSTLIPLSRRHSSFPAQAVPFHEAVADEQGIVILGGQPAGSREYRIEGPGLQFRVETAVVKEAATTELGRIVLSPADGQVWVSVDGTLMDGEVLEVELAMPFATLSPRNRVEMVLETHVFRALCVDRWYLLHFVHRRADGKRGQFIVNSIELTRAKSLQEFRIKLADFRYE
ncbi:MAG: hypothetical protein KF754_06345 [Planctomycetes bacterium]|nr:hypothetical protein [Planctomycetota bacterium]